LNIIPNGRTSILILKKKYPKIFIIQRYQEPPPMPFVFKVKKIDKLDVPDKDKSEWIKLKSLMDPDNSVPKYS
jgi:hypothetical protein